MISYDEALAIARSKKSKFNKCEEYNIAYVFFFDDGTDRDGGENPIAIIKATGEAVHFITFAKMPNKELIRSFDV